MLTFDDEDDHETNQIDAIRQQKKEEAKLQVVITESVTQSRYKSITNEGAQIESKGSLASKT